MRLIDGDELKADYGMAEDCKNCKTGYRSCEYDRIYSKMDFCGWIDDAETVDAVEVVRCRDCKRWDKYHNEQIGECKWTFQVTKAEGYCNYGERKDGDSHDGS